MSKHLQYATAPEALKGAEDRSKGFLAAASLETGVATKYWLELVAYPPGSARSLWLLLNNVWRHLDNPNDGTQISVQNAFCNCPNVLEVAVWAIGDVIVGLVVRSK